MNQFTRTQMLFGGDAIEKLKHSHVAVFGVGGVGGYVMEVLARSGIGAIDLIDNDYVSVSNINRQIIALHSTIGRSKVDVAEERIHDINPECKVKTFRTFYLPSNAEGFDLSQYDYVVDCIDTVSAKIELIRRCHGLGVPLLSCMGAANKMDATAFRIADINDTEMDPLAKVIRKKLRKLGIQRQKVVYSSERPMKPVTQYPVENTNKPQEELKETQTEARNAQEMRKEPQEKAAVEVPAGTSKRPVPASNAFVPAAAGLIAGGEVVKDIIFKL